MSQETDRLSLQWRREANETEDEANAHRLQAIQDDVEGRPDMAERNRRTAARLQGSADALKACARQLSTVSARG